MILNFQSLKLFTFVGHCCHHYHLQSNFHCVWLGNSTVLGSITRVTRVEPVSLSLVNRRVFVMCYWVAGAVHCAGWRVVLDKSWGARITTGRAAVSLWRASCQEQDDCDSAGDWGEVSTPAGETAGRRDGVAAWWHDGWTQCDWLAETTTHRTWRSTTQAAGRYTRRVSTCRASSQLITVRGAGWWIDSQLSAAWCRHSARQHVHCHWRGRFTETSTESQLRPQLHHQWRWTPRQTHKTVLT